MIVFVFAVLLSATPFDRAAVILEQHVDVNLTVLVNASDLGGRTLALGGPYKMCGRYPVALAKCGSDYDIGITVSNRHSPSVGTILHELGHGLGFARNSIYSDLTINGYIGFVKTDDTHLANKRSVMYKYSNGQIVPDRDMLYVLERIGYTVHYSPAASVFLALQFAILQCLAVCMQQALQTLVMETRCSANKLDQAASPRRTIAAH